MSYADFSVKYCSKDERRYNFWCNILQQPFLLFCERKKKLKRTFLSILYRGIQGSLSVGSLTVRRSRKGRRETSTGPRRIPSRSREPTDQICGGNWFHLPLIVFSPWDNSTSREQPRYSFRGKVFECSFFFWRVFKVTSVRTSANIIWQGALLIGYIFKLLG